MPFTPAHAAAAWPVRRMLPALPLAALVIGTFSPDFEYLLRLQPSGAFGHTRLGLLVFCLPLSLAAWLAFERWVRPLANDCLPAARSGTSALLANGFPTVRTGILACVAVLIGAATHVLWDGFTHRGGWAVARFPALLAPASAALPFPRYWVGQIASSVAGVAFVALWALAAWRSADARLSDSQRSRLVRLSLVVILGAAVAAGANVLVGGSMDFKQLAGRAAVGGMDGGIVTVLAMGVVRRRGTRPPEA